MKFKESITPEEIETLDLISFPGEIQIITEEGPAFKEAVRHLSSCRMIGFDTETKPIFQPHAPRCATALLQLSSEERSFLFRLHTLGLPKPLADILASKSITKVGAAVADDVRGLQHYTDFTAARFMDLQRFAEQFGIKDKSVKKLAAIILGRRVSKAQQCSNWEAPVLSYPQQLYAATDAWICLVMYKKLLESGY
ncbi:MAG: 3'-5' exonuclease domain-containing protein 2 [Bacteroidales bacterium]|nr:3'-5' exonuclease domain-containing protein 2 [Bacteroidales bacterium]MBQ6082514.1 3'-5' exonuclease domain-containing protein 2 [Bacteroidales bacterium]